MIVLLCVKQSDTLNYHTPRHMWLLGRNYWPLILFVKAMIDTGSFNILAHPIIWGQHRPLCSMTNVKERSRQICQGYKPYIFLWKELQEIGRSLVLLYSQKDIKLPLHLKYFEFIVASKKSKQAWCLHCISFPDKQDQIGIDRSTSWSLIPIQGPRRSRGRPTESQGVKG